MRCLPVYSASSHVILWLVVLQMWVVAAVLFLNFWHCQNFELKIVWWTSLSMRSKSVVFLIDDKRFDHVSLTIVSFVSNSPKSHSCKRSLKWFSLFITNSNNKPDTRTAGFVRKQCIYKKASHLQQRKHDTKLQIIQLYVLLWMNQITAHQLILSLQLGGGAAILDL